MRRGDSENAYDTDEGGSNSESGSEEEFGSDRRQGRRRESTALGTSSGSSNEIIEVGCGWVKVKMSDLCRKSRILTLDVMHGDPWSTKGQKIPEDDLKQQDGLRHRWKDTYPSSLGWAFGRARKCTITIYTAPVRESMFSLFPAVEEYNLHISRVRKIKKRRVAVSQRGTRG